MNIEQIAITVDAEMYDEGRLSAATAYPAEFLRRCLSKLAEQAGEPVGSERYRVEKRQRGFWPYCVVAGTGTMEIFIGHQKQCTKVANALAAAFEDGKFAAQQRTAEACAKVCENMPCKFRSEFVSVSSECAKAIRNNWREYL